jgi:CRP-like cAMP-binding protein
VPLLSRVRGATLRDIRARAARLTTATGEEVIRRWDADRSFYIIVSGQFDVLIDGRRIRALGPADHFGELAALDWGAGYGYTRLATVVSAGSGELLRLTGGDFQWLLDTEPTVRAAIARDLADRLPER